MNKEEIEELKEFTIDLNNIDELALGLEICSKKSNMVIQEFIDTIVQLQQENQKLKKQLEEANEKILLLQASEPMLEYKKALEENQQKEFVDYLENEKDRLTRECSPTYKYSLGKTRFVNEDIFNEVDTILSKYNEIIEK